MNFSLMFISNSIHYDKIGCFITCCLLCCIIHEDIEFVYLCDKELNAGCGVIVVMFRKIMRHGVEENFDCCHSLIVLITIISSFISTLSFIEIILMFGYFDSLFGS